MNTISSILESWETKTGVELSIDESASEVDGVIILAKISGPAFFPETLSRNNVYYPQEAWETAIAEEEFQSRLKDRLVYGTIGHDCELTDIDIRNGLASHIVIRVWINEENVGMAEHLVLNTDAGRNLNTYVRAKSKLRVSTKADGLFKSTPQSSKTVVPNAFRFTRIDFVQSPGYIQALPSVVESIEKDLLENKIQEEDINKLTGNKNMEDNKVVNILESQISELKAEKVGISQQVSKITEELNSTSFSLKTAESIVEGYKALGTVAAISEAKQELQQFRSIGSVQQIHEALEEGSEAIDKLNETVAELTETVNRLTNEVKQANEGADAITASARIDPDAPVYHSGEDLGTPEEINTVLNTVEADQEELGSPAEIRDALDLAEEQRLELDEYKKLGSPDEIKAALNAAETVAESIETDQASKLADEFGVDKSVVTKALDKGMSFDDIRELLECVHPKIQEGDKDTKKDSKDTSLDSATKAKESNTSEADISESYTSKLFAAARKRHTTIEEGATIKSNRSNAPLVSRLFGRR